MAGTMDPFCLQDWVGGTDRKLMLGRVELGRCGQDSLPHCLEGHNSAATYQTQQDAEVFLGKEQGPGKAWPGGHELTKLQHPAGA